MVYTPVSQRNNQPKKSAYTPVRERVFDVRDPLGTGALISGATRNIRLAEQQPETTEQQITKLSQRDMSQDVIKAQKPSLLQRARRSLPEPLSQALFGTGRESAANAQIIPGVRTDTARSDTGALGFFYEALTKSDQRKYDELTNNLTNKGVDSRRASLIASGQVEDLTPEEERAVNTKKLVDVAFIGLESLDFIPVLGAMTKPGRTALKSSIMNRLASETDPAKIETALNKAGTIFSNNNTTELAQAIAKARDVETIQTNIDNFVQSNRKYTPVRNRQAGSETLETLAKQREDLLVINTGRTFDGRPVKSVSTDSLLSRDIAGVGAEDPQQIARVVEKIRNGEEIEPLRIQIADGVAYVEDGKHRLEAARQLGLDTVDVIEVPIARQTPKKPSQPARIKIDAELQDIRDAVQNRSITVEEIGQLETRVDILEKSLPDVRPIKTIAGRQFQQYDTLAQVQDTASKQRQANELARNMTVDESSAILKNQSEHNAKTLQAARIVRRANLDDVVTRYGFDDLDEAGAAIRAFDEQTESLVLLRETLKSKKAQRALANKTEKVARAASKGRKNLVNELRDQFGLSNSDIQKLSNRQDYRMMSDTEFGSFINRLEQKAVELADTRQAKAELVDLLERRHFEKVENYRKTQGFPPVSQMNSQQLRQYADSLEQFQTGDEFLTTRQLEVVERSELTGVKTMREARERLLEQVKKMPGMEKTTLEDLQNIKVSALDNLRYDTSLAEKNPYYNFVVNRTQTHMLNGEANFLQVQNKVNELARTANKSRDRGLKGSIRQALIPKNDEIVRYLEAPMSEKKAFAEKLTSEELDYANYMQQYYSDAYDHLVKVKELYGSRYVDQYFTHMKRDFLEAWSDDGIVKAMREWWQSQKDDQAIANIIDQDTGNILPKAKFFQYTLQRTGEVTPSKNVTRVFLQYAQMFERKKMFDAMIPEVDIYTQSLTPKNLTPKGLEMDRSLKTLINKYLNNKKGRRENFGGIIKQSGPADIAIRMGNTLVSLIDLGLALGPSVAASVGEQVMTYQALGKIGYTRAWKRRIWDTGLKRMSDKNASKILKESEAFIGRNIWTDLADPDQGIMDKGLKTIFGAFSQSTVEANKLFLLANLTQAELKAGKLSADRLAQLRLEAGRWRDLGRDVKSIVGSTSLGEMTTKYKGWAIPIARTNITNVVSLAKGLKQGNFKETLTSREAAETYRAIELSAVLVMVGSYVMSEEEDESFIGQLKARAYMESMTLLGGIDPTVFLSTPRLYSFLQQLGGNLKDIVTLEQYQQDSRWGETGDLKGVSGLQRQFTPSAFEQFGQTKETTRRSSGGKSAVDFGFGDLSNQGDMGEVDFGFDELDFGFDQ